MLRALLAVLSACVCCCALAQSNHVDIVRNDAPELASYGEYDIGVRTVEFTDADRPKVLTTMPVLLVSDSSQLLNLG